MPIYLDSCCFNRPFDDQSQVRVLLETEAKLVVQERIRSGELQLVWSYIMDFENDANPFEDRRNSISQWRDLATIDISESEEVVARAEDLSRLGFKAKDSIHLSCAIEAQCKIFLSTDKGILNKADLVPGLAILNPVDYDFTEDDD
ncbi:MAG: PIN domain protein [Akkermansiaceae bacterium]